MLLAHRAIATTVAILALTGTALAGQSLVKPAPTPAPSAGPTVAAAAAFCGDAPDKAEVLIQRYSTDAKLQQVYTSREYVAFGDDKANPTVMYTFTTKEHLAHPAAVCRRIEKEGDSVVIKMHVVCDGEAEACGKLRNDFNVMTAKMQVEVNQKIDAQKK